MLRRGKIIKCVLIINVINEISSQINYYANFLFNSSEIILKINKTGTNNILYNKHLNKEFPCPSFIYLNDEIQNLTNCTKININTSGSTVKLVWNTPLNSTRCLFCGCPNIIEIKFLNFDTSLLTHMAGPFKDCNSLTSVDVSSLNTKNVNLMRKMFRNCYSIKFINLSNFDTSNVMEMHDMFYNCKKLTSIDLSNFDTSKVSNMSNLFYNCNNLEYINLLNFTDIKNPNITNMFNGIKKNAVICIDKNKAPSIYNIADNMPCVAISCRPDWWNVQYKVYKTGECIINCSSTINRYEYKGKCYDMCDSNCKTCYFEDNIPSTNCSSCYENKFLKNGKCVDSCENGYYLDYKDLSIKICKCDIIKCEKCSSESISSNNLCLSCNIDKDYYPLINDTKNNGDFIECYSGNISGYYLDKNDNYYKPCYNTCDTCYLNGNEIIHNCIECKEGYNLKIKKGSYYNCELECNDSFYYYNQDGKFKCLNSLECPEDFNNLIPELGQCIDNCSKIIDYKYEFRKQCFSKCPKDISYLQNDNLFFCEVKCNKTHPFEIIEKQICTNFCDINDMKNNSCISKYKDEGTNENLILFNIRKDIITTNFDKSDLYNNGEDIIIEEGKAKFIITTYNKTKNSLQPQINLEDCKNILINEYSIGNFDKLVILIINIKKDNNIINPLSSTGEGVFVVDFVLGEYEDDIKIEQVVDKDSSSKESFEEDIKTLKLNEVYNVHQDYVKTLFDIRRLYENDDYKDQVEKLLNDTMNKNNVPYPVTNENIRLFLTGETLSDNNDDNASAVRKRPLSTLTSAVFNDKIIIGE